MLPLYFWQKLTRECACSPGCDCSLRETSLHVIYTVTSHNRVEYLQADYDIFRHLAERHDFVTSNDVMQHILSYNSAMEHLINYCIFLHFYPLYFPVVQGHVFAIPHW